MLVMTEANAVNLSPVSIANSLAGLTQALSVLTHRLIAADLAQQADDRALLVIQEIVTNISRYGFDDANEHSIEVSFAVGDGALTLTFDDDGRPFDPRSAPNPDLHRWLANAPIGGRGLFLVRKT